MRRAKVFIRSALWGVISLATVAGCEQISDLFFSSSFVDVADDRTKLINGLESYASVEETKRQFPQWEVIENSGLKSGDTRPPLNIYTVVVKGYSHLNCQGELRLTFFNNRLMEAWFIPGEFEKYIGLLKSQAGITFQAGPDSHGWPEAKQSPYTQILIPGYGEEGKMKYVSWVDVRLKKELALWIKKYS